MVNLRARANVLTSRINPNISVGYRRYEGHAVGSDGSVTPQYAAQTSVVAQVQSLGKKEVDHLSSLRISNCERMVYVNFQLQATDRVAQTGGDLVVFEGAVWQVEAVLEGWTTAGWSRGAVSKQMDAPNG
jgi:hypothetical protein